MNCISLHLFTSLIPLGKVSYLLVYKSLTFFSLDISLSILCFVMLLLQGKNQTKEIKQEIGEVVLEQQRFIWDQPVEGVQAETGAHLLLKT